MQGPDLIDIGYDADDGQRTRRVESVRLNKWRIMRFMDWNEQEYHEWLKRYEIGGNDDERIIS